MREAVQQEQPKTGEATDKSAVEPYKLQVAADMAFNEVGHSLGVPLPDRVGNVCFHLAPVLRYEIPHQRSDMPVHPIAKRLRGCSVEHGAYFLLTCR